MPTIELYAYNIDYTTAVGWVDPDAPFGPAVIVSPAPEGGSMRITFFSGGTTYTITNQWNLGDTTVNNLLFERHDNSPVGLYEIQNVTWWNEPDGYSETFPSVVTAGAAAVSLLKIDFNDDGDHEFYMILSPVKNTSSSRYLIMRSAKLVGVDMGYRPSSGSSVVVPSGYRGYKVSYSGLRFTFDVNTYSSWFDTAPMTTSGGGLIY